MSPNKQQPAGNTPAALTRSAAKRSNPQAIEALDGLRRRFADFRREHEPRTRIPNDLRQAVLKALAQGVSMAELRRECGLTAGQVADWQKEPQPLARKHNAPAKAARVFDVTDAQSQTKNESAKPNGICEPLELRIGAWAITIHPPVC